MSLYKIEQRLLALGLNQEQADEIVQMVREFGTGVISRYPTFLRPAVGDM